MDADWSRWRQEIFGDPYLVWHDGPDFSAMLAAARYDPAHVARMLRAGLDAGDSLAAQAFAQLAEEGLAPADTVDLLRRAAVPADGELLIRIAEALYVLTADPSWSGHIVRVLRDGDSEFVRLDAAIALANFPPSPALVTALAEAVNDTAYLVRYHSATTLIKYAGGMSRFGDGPALFAKITSEDPAQWRLAADELAAHVR
ncbi:hypothetical protein [Paractinoplanes rishiriensis]|uniref:HEAT repeat domain-containing protein n=1 Tax=Paractinoplanes rishiriensis TaxID=1050105 RepID=A0A919K4F4_9ACTN|nr:hypothetical protein [Actinoplanes rishiriensis]GIF00606.1 hypothetical protein Ari01nite_80700 [Actinoplanes rishiriensis]